MSGLVLVGLTACQHGGDAFYVARWRLTQAAPVVSEHRGPDLDAFLATVESMAIRLPAACEAPARGLKRTELLALDCGMLLGELQDALHQIGLTVAPVGVAQATLVIREVPIEVRPGQLVRPPGRPDYEMSVLAPHPRLRHLDMDDAAVDARCRDKLEALLAEPRQQVELHADIVPVGAEVPALSLKLAMSPEQDALGVWEAEHATGVSASKMRVFADPAVFMFGTLYGLIVGTYGAVVVATDGYLADQFLIFSIIGYSIASLAIGGRLLGRHLTVWPTSEDRVCRRGPAQWVRRDHDLERDERLSRAIASMVAEGLRR